MGARNSREFHIVAAGKPDPGIATIVNGLVRANLFTGDEMENEGVVTKEHIRQGLTAKVTVIKGLGCSDQIGAQQITAACPQAQVGVVLYCIPIQPDTQFDEESVKEGTRKLTEAYGVEVWKHGVVV